MKKTKLKVHKFYDSLYLAEILLCVGDPNDLDAYIKKEFDIKLAKDPLEYDGVVFKVLGRNKDEETIYVIFVRELERTDVLAHEAIHLVKDIFLDRGVEVDLEKGDEHFTYYFSYLLKLFHSKLKKPKKRKKKSLTKKK